MSDNSPATANAATGGPSIRAVALRKSFGGVHALNGANLTIERGTIHGLVGHNGAGKTTLVNVLAGVMQPDSGRLSVLDEAVVLRSPRDALHRGIGVLFQQLSLWPHLTIAENLWLETDVGSDSVLLNRRRMRAAAMEALARVGVEADPSTRISELSFSDQQLVALARVLQLDARIVILDEPTSSLGPQEVSRLASLLRGLAGEGISLLFISHRLGEIMDICDIVTIFRDGKDVATLPIHESSSSRLVELMMGSALALRDRGGIPSAEGQTDELIFDAQNITHRDQPLLLRLAVRCGEIVGVLGLPGSGREGLLHTLAGDRSSGRVGILKVRGKPVNARPWHLHRHGITLVPSDRAREGVFPTLTLLENVIVGTRTASQIRRPAVERALTESFAERLRIRFHDVTDPIWSLSGGNQQKAVLARALVGQSQLMILDEPTNGVDVGTREDIHRIIGELASEGLGLVVGSSDPEELAGLCHRILVIHGSEVVGEYLPPHNITQMMLAATGGNTPSA